MLGMRARGRLVAFGFVLTVTRRRFAVALLLCVLACCAGVGFAPAHALPPAAIAGVAAAAPSQFGVELQGGGVVTGATNRRILHFTFDDGPDPRTTPRLLDELDRAGVKATFFFSTSRFADRAHRNAHAVDLAREVARRGHALGSHGFDHQRMARMKPPQQRAQLDSSAAMFDKVFGTRTFLIRPPFGSRNAALDRMLADGKYVTVMWNIGMADWNARPADQIESTFFRVLARNERERGERGGVVLLHDTHEWSIEAFQRIAAAIARKNCELLSAGEELYSIENTLSAWLAPPSDAVYAARQAELRERTRARCAAPDQAAR